MDFALCFCTLSATGPRGKGKREAKDGEKRGQTLPDFHPSSTVAAINVSMK